MRLVDVAVTVVGGRTAAVANARTRWSRRRGLLLTVRDADGRVGRGEASPLPGYSDDAFGTVRRTLKIWCDGAPPRLDLTDPVAAVRRQVDTLPTDVPSARFAVETALLDLAGQVQGRPVWALLRDDDTAPEPVPISTLLDVAGRREDGATTDAAVGTVVRAARSRGIDVLKLKVGQAGRHGEELAVLRAARVAGGPALDLRLDANGALASETLDATLDAFAIVRPSLIEEPISGPALGTLTASPIAIAVDETLRHADGWSVVERLATAERLAAVVLKPMVLGGALACLDLAGRAASLGVGSYVTHLFDGPVARAATGHLALALPGPRLASGLDAHPMLDIWPTWTAPLLGDAAIVGDQSAGLGLPAMPDDAIIEGS